MVFSPFCRRFPANTLAGPSAFSQGRKAGNHSVRREAEEMENIQMTRKKKVLLGMSGGVDSSAAALLLLEQGCEVEGVTLRLRPDSAAEAGAGKPEAHGASGDIRDAALVARALGIPHSILDLREEFQTRVIRNFAEEYAAGRTPNPCAVCNRHIKFGAMLDYALNRGFDYIATGHYARITREETEQGPGRWQLRSVPSSKDQSYMLYSLSQEQLSHTLLPLAAYTKEEIRRIAERAGLPVAKKPDSQEICFIPDNDYIRFLSDYTGREAPEGDFVTAEGAVIGRHKGITHYTIGQRKGLGAAFGRPMYVTAILPEENRVVLGPEGSQYSASLLAQDVNWIAFASPAPGQTLHCEARIRYHAAPAPCTVRVLPGGKLRAEFSVPQRSVTPGQAVVLYDGDLALGGGVICREE